MTRCLRAGPLRGSSAPLRGAPLAAVVSATAALALACGGGEAPVEPDELVVEATHRFTDCDLDTFVPAESRSAFLRRGPSLDAVAIDAVPVAGTVHVTGAQDDGWLRLDVAYDADAETVHEGEAWVQPGTLAVSLVNALSGAPPVLRVAPSDDAAPAGEWRGVVLVRSCSGPWIQVDEGEGGQGWIGREHACGREDGACGAD